ncbi:isoprenylcysteine carboxylmethyltransferase family protein [Actinomadura sp. 7K507]|uniref:methyltransferase family protein n=1 Tax=Actinomadura sp. 7K507 TaxID=2530365 RepID=UPI00104BFA15|nr:isoprenylcysteine carboxylmethyltransferase family protein [Actinomadura sp. 7K507]TDC97075.1 isoprenylcysteine carboxylmethyltransferase family protein [Actinomadura sp. 7K507]
MAVFALAIWVVWALLAFGLRGWIQWRRTGDAGFRGIGWAPGAVHWWAGVLVVAGFVLGAAGPMAALAGMEAVTVLDHAFVRGGGAVVALGGAAGTVAAQLSMGASWRVGVDEAERTELVTAGVFALARNPIFTAMIVTVAGLTAMVPNPVALGGLAVTVVAIELQVRAVEEPYLRRVHGDAYARYAATVGRFLPGIGRHDLSHS